MSLTSPKPDASRIEKTDAVTIEASQPPPLLAKHPVQPNTRMLRRNAWMAKSVMRMLRTAASRGSIAGDQIPG
jgi:hypothetical protein